MSNYLPDTRGVENVTYEEMEIRKEKLLPSVDNIILNMDKIRKDWMELVSKGRNAEPPKSSIFSDDSLFVCDRINRDVTSKTYEANDKGISDEFCNELEDILNADIYRTIVKNGETMRKSVSCFGMAMLWITDVYLKIFKKRCLKSRVNGFPLFIGDFKRVRIALSERTKKSITTLFNDKSIGNPWEQGAVDSILKQYSGEVLESLYEKLRKRYS